MSNTIDHGPPASPRPPFRRTSADRRPLDVPPRPRWPTWLRRLLLGLLLLALLIPLWIAWHEWRKPHSLATSDLGGTRLVTGPICIDEAVDISGSMTEFTAQRVRAERALFDFSRRALEPDDVLTEAFFAASSQVALPPTPMTSITVPPTVPNLPPNDTMLAPAIKALQAARSDQTCAARALVVITDGLIADPDDVEQALRNASYTRVYAVVPLATGWRRPGPLKGELGSVTVFHFTDGGFNGQLGSVLDDAKPLDVIYGDIVGSLTGQHLVKSKH